MSFRETLFSMAVVSAVLPAAANADQIEFTPTGQVEIRLSLGGEFSRTGAPTTFDRSFLRFEGVIGGDFDFGNFTISPQIESFGWNTKLDPGRLGDNELLASVGLSFGNWVVSVGDLTGTGLPLPQGISTHTVIETRPIFAYYATRQDQDAENAAPINGFRDNSKISSSGKLALAYNAENWFVRGIVDPGIATDYDRVAGVFVAREYYRLEGGINFNLAGGTMVRAGASLWHQDSFQSSNGSIVDTGTGTKAGRWGTGALGMELGVVVDFGKLDVGASMTAIRGPYSDTVTSTAPDDLRQAFHLTASYQLNDRWSMAGTYSQTRWELSNNPALDLHTGRLLQIGVETQLNENVSAGFGYVWSDSTGWTGGGVPEAKLAYPVLGINISF